MHSPRHLFYAQHGVNGRPESERHPVCFGGRHEQGSGHGERCAPLPRCVRPCAWAKIGLLSFGGPAGQIALMHRMLVDELRWIDERRYLSALNFCMLLPGPRRCNWRPTSAGGFTV